MKGKLRTGRESEVVMGSLKGMASNVCQAVIVGDRDVGWCEI